jgi:hypothetical protein
MKRAMKVLLCCAALVCATGCSGLEIGGKAWVMKVDESYSSQKTHKTPPLKCLFVSCKAETEEVTGS